MPAEPSPAPASPDRSRSLNAPVEAWTSCSRFPRNPVPQALPPITHRSKSSLLVLSIFITAAATVLWLPTLSLATNRGQVLRCSNAGTPEELFLADITTRRVSCGASRRFIVTINEHRRDLKSRKTRYRRYDCRPRQDGVAAWIRCTRGRQLIRWLEGT
jgi:hypothetical protein